MVGQDTGGVAAGPRAEIATVKYRIVVLPRAKGDLQEIDDYLAAANAAAADRFAENVRKTLQLQASLPTPGSPWHSLNPALAGLRWTRVKGFRKYLIFMRIEESVLYVVRVLHGARDLEPLLGSG